MEHQMMQAGSYELTFTYRKDSSTSSGTDTAYIKNVKLIEGAEVNTTTVKGGEMASTTQNIYGVYDMSGGANDYVMGNIVSNDGTTMMSGYLTSSNSGYTGIIHNSENYTSYTGTYSYPDMKYYDKYSFGTGNSQRIRSKLGDGIKEVKTSSRGWYSDNSSLAYSNYPWFVRGGLFSSGSNAGAFYSNYSSGFASTNYSSRLVITP